MPRVGAVAELFRKREGKPYNFYTVDEAQAVLTPRPGDEAGERGEA
jgi:hypothetical protein